MAKKPTAEHGRGEIRDNALKALVTSKLFQMQVVKAKKGKGSYSRQKFKQGQKCDHSALFVSVAH
ncbi:ribosome alternative rescue factor ArfA [Rheinheimera sp. 1928-s]|uniref:alternative ribosome-rescue factor A n=1 Tax=Rheinheimera sp. 1928-s TaxID=3033803 RepID=UPI002621B7BD|nr:ribosome alternative rescue factor ArfA [Rheinheimera sp. 1928-s]MDF3125035.1 ribosome alternative rescue factor ArfA [Rheinheimera sp. 1928-s]